MKNTYYVGTIGDLVASIDQSFTSSVENPILLASADGKPRLAYDVVWGKKCLNGISTGSPHSISFAALQCSSRLAAQTVLDAVDGCHDLLQELTVSIMLRRRPLCVGSGKNCALQDVIRCVDGVIDFKFVHLRHINR